jgi:DNA-binding CsgD family transcriptional regulator
MLATSLRLVAKEASAKPDDTAAPPCVAEGLQPRFLCEALDRLDQGLVVLTAQRRVTYSNRTAVEALAAAQGLRVRRGVVEVTDPADARQFESAVVGAIERGLQQLIFLRASGADAGAIALAVMPMRTIMPGGVRVLLVMGRRAWSDLSLQWFARSQGLTQAEAVVLRMLCAGHAPRVISRELGVAISTVRSQLSAIRHKTGAASLRALVQRVFSLPPVGCCLLGTTAS